MGLMDAAIDGKAPDAIRPSAFQADAAGSRHFPSPDYAAHLHTAALSTDVCLKVTSVTGHAGLRTRRTASGNSQELLEAPRPYRLERGR